MRRYLLLSPGIRGTAEWCVFFVVCAVAVYYSVLPLPHARLFLWIGIAVGAIGFLIHGASHAVHHQAHSAAGEIERLVTGGVYSLVRHPGYLGLMLTDVGIGLACMSWVSLGFGVLLACLCVPTALAEEEALVEKFGRDYERYREKVRWRFLPYLF